MSHFSLITSIIHVNKLHAVFRVFFFFLLCCLPYLKFFFYLRFLASLVCMTTISQTNFLHQVVLFCCFCCLRFGVNLNRRFDALKHVSVAQSFSSFFFFNCITLDVLRFRLVFCLHRTKAYSNLFNLHFFLLFRFGFALIHIL